MNEPTHDVRQDAPSTTIERFSIHGLGSAESLHFHLDTGGELVSTLTRGGFNGMGVPNGVRHLPESLVLVRLDVDDEDLAFTYVAPAPSVDAAEVLARTIAVLEDLRAQIDAWQTEGPR